MALTANDNSANHCEGIVQNFNVQSGVTIYKNALVCTNLSGLLVPASNTIGLTVQGEAYQKVVQAAADTDKSGKVISGVRKLMKCAGADQTWVGRMAYVEDDETIEVDPTDSAVSNLVVAGRVVQYVSATSVWIALPGAPQFATTGGENYFQSVSLGGLRILSGNQIMVMAASGGGLMGSDTTPALNVITSATDGCLRITTAASAASTSLIFQIALDPALNTGRDINVVIRAYMAGATDTPTFTLSSFFDEGDTALADTSGALSATATNLKIAIAAADVPAGASTMSVTIVIPATDTDALYITGVSVEYTKG